MKKFIYILLTLALLVSMGTTALAADKSDKVKEPKQKEESVRREHSRPDADAEGISAQDAMDTALESAGFAADEVKGLHAYKLYDRGTAVAYRVEFAVYDAQAHETTVYTVDLDLSSGELVNSAESVHAH